MTTPKNPSRPASITSTLLALLALLGIASPAFSQEAARPSPAARPADSSTKDEPVVLSIFQVTDDKDEGYRSSQTISGSRTLANLRDTPNSISVVNRELLDDLNVTKIADALYFSVTGEISTDTEDPNERFVFRGIQANLKLRNGVTWYGGVTDTYNIERVELLRGPQAFLYGEGTAGGLINQITKQANYRNSEKMNLLFGSHRLYRGEFDINRRVTDKFAVRLALAYSDEGTFQHYAERRFEGAYATVNWRPFKNTNINADAEYRFTHGIIGSNMLADGFSLTPRTGATTTLAVTTGGRTFIPALGTIIDTVGRRRSVGTAIALSDESILPRELNFLGPHGPMDSNELAFGLHLDQKIFENFNVQASYTYFDIEKWTDERIGNSSGSVYRDINPTLPSGAPNPYFNELYTEYYNRRLNGRQPVHNARVTAVYEWKLPFTVQKIVGSAVYHDARPGDYRYSEFVDPASGAFKGTLNPANTLAAYTANIAVMNQNFFYRRFYLKDGDGTRLTGGGAIAGQSLIHRDLPADGATGRLSDRLYRTPAMGIGADGSYFNGRIHSLIGWRRSSFNQDPSRDYYNTVTGETYKLDSTPITTTRITEDAINYGAVLYVSPMVGAYYNYAESVSLSSGVGASLLTPGKLRGPLLGDGHEYGLRWSFLDGRLESNWTYYITKALKNAAVPAVPANVRQTELGPIFGSAIDVAGTDTQSTKSTGFEIETTANITKNWRLMWNIAKSDLVLSDRYPALKGFQAQAKEKGARIPDTDAFLATVPDGTPLPGFTKLRSNLVSMYRFTDGPLKNFSIGAGVQYRDKSYIGNFDLNQDGVAEELWTKGYNLWTFMAAYRTKILNRNVNLSLDVYNVFDQDYFRSFALATGGWGDGRNFRCAARFEF